MAADPTEQPAPPAPMTEAEFIAWMERLGFRLTDPQAREMFLAYELLARMTQRVRADRGLGVEPPSLTLPRVRAREGRGPIVAR
jgi:hypothetical protein